MRRFIRLALIAMPLIVVGCGEDQSTTPARFDSHLYVANASTITQQINDLYPTTLGHLDAAQSKWRALQDAIAKDKPNQHTKLMHLIDWTIKREQDGVLMDPNGDAPPSTRVAVSILVASLFQAVYPDAPTPPVVPEGTDFGAGVVSPTATTVIVSEESQAGAEFVAGTYSREVLVTFVEQQDPPPGGSGPLSTRAYYQYPKFYRLTAFPNDPIQQDVRVGVCHVTDEESPYFPPEPHTALRVARDVPNGEGVNFEILERVEVADFLLCFDVTAEEPPIIIGATELSGFRGLAVRTINKAFTGIVSFVTPQPLYAIDQGIGGRLPASDGESETGADAVYGLVDDGSGDTGEGGGCDVEICGANMDVSSASSSQSSAKVSAAQPTRRGRPIK